MLLQVLCNKKREFQFFDPLQLDRECCNRQKEHLGAAADIQVLAAKRQVPAEARRGLHGNAALHRGGKMVWRAEENAEVRGQPRLEDPPEPPGRELHQRHRASINTHNRSVDGSNENQ